MRLLLRFWREGRQWLDEKDDQPASPLGQKTINSIVGLQDEDATVEFDVFLEVVSKPPSFNETVQVGLIDVRVDRMRIPFRSFDLVETWLREDYHDQVLDTAALL